ncbi:Uracil-DNA glycosylase [Astathelohania contejeani]|uniref:Uracil-DNA glycosylase n=1 Tax=Astathelohania contejeani TaxID=164912 RepID=A0ABQ7I1X1_9MICR|nr:Uracil-DNA glycosylase [Thelohania contejeani]
MKKETRRLIGEKKNILYYLNNKVNAVHTRCGPLCKICMLEDFLPKDWYMLLDTECLSSIKEKLHTNEIIYPKIENIFRFASYFKLEHTKVVILGQDPYHGPNQATGLAFSVPEECTLPPSLRNIFKEVKTCYPKSKVPRNGSLERWAQQGVLLLNDTLTVVKGRPNSHAHIGWNVFTENIIRKINDCCNGVVFMLWGAHAQKKSNLIDPIKHCVLIAPHPSPFSAARGFFGCGHFSKANEYLIRSNKTPIEW